jgi:RNA polymerase sigma-70 factor (ECF subfamily)
MNKPPDPARWLDQYGDALYRYALFRIRDPDRAEDLVQETLLAALKARNRYAHQSSEKTWLVGILKHKLIDQLRKSKREVSLDGLTEGDITLDSLYFNERGEWRAELSLWSDPEKSLEQARFWRVLHDCIARLPERLATLFILREIDGLSVEECCKALAISTTNNTYVMLSRARMRMRECLEVRWFGRGMEDTPDVDL